MVRNASILTGAALATLLAGPIFIVSSVAAWLYLEMPKPVVVQPQEILFFALACVLSTLAGCILAIVPNMLGSSLLYAVGKPFFLAREPWVWTVAGALGGAGIVVATNAVQLPPVAFGLVATSTACATICRRFAVWG